MIASGLMMWKGMGLLTNTESPIVVVLRYTDICFVDSALPNSFVGTNITNSGSMEPAFYRGDLLFLTNPAHERYHTGDITVYKIPGADIPIVHRVLETHDMVAASTKSNSDQESGYVVLGWGVSRGNVDIGAI